MSLTTFVYETNGLVLSSEIQLPELLESNKKPTIFFRFGKTPENLNNPFFKKVFQQANSEEYLLDMKLAARYWIKNNQEVVIEPYENVQEDAIRVYLLSFIMGVLIHKHEFLPLHSCCIKFNGSAVLIAGNSGAGKSTISLGLYRKGYEILNDDISTISFDENRNPIVSPGYVHLKLWSESLKKYGYEPAEFNRLRKEIEKYSFPIKRDVNQEALPIKAIFILNPNGEELNVEQIKGLKSFDILKQHTLRKNLLKGLGKEVSHFHLCTEVASKVKVFQVKRPDGVSPSEFSDFMETQILNALD